MLRRSAVASYSGRHRNGQRREFLLWHERSSARRRKSQRHWAHSRKARTGRNGLAEIRRFRPDAGHKETLVVRLRSCLRRTDGRVCRAAIRKETNESIARCSEKRKILSAPQASLR